MTKEETGDVWIAWLLDAIHKIRYQKQRPNVERVAQCIRQHHPQYSNETVHQVRDKSVQISKKLEYAIFSLTSSIVYNLSTRPIFRHLFETKCKKCIMLKPS